MLGTPIGIIKFHVVEADTSFLLCFEDMNKLNIYFNNFENVLIISTKSVLVFRYFGYPFFFWDIFLQLFIAKSFNNNFCLLTDIKLRQLHDHFGYPSICKLYKVLKYASHKTNKKLINNLTKYCIHCQKHKKSPD